eukprot:scaffold161374_cov27-Tisochrysis_lutea.AAC.2
MESWCRRGVAGHTQYENTKLYNEVVVDDGLVHILECHVDAWRVTDIAGLLVVRVDRRVCILPFLCRSSTSAAMKRKGRLMPLGIVREAARGVGREHVSRRRNYVFQSRTCRPRGDRGEKAIVRATKVAKSLFGCLAHALHPPPRATRPREAAHTTSFAVRYQLCSREAWSTRFAWPLGAPAGMGLKTSLVSLDSASLLEKQT